MNRSILLIAFLNSITFGFNAKKFLNPSSNRCLQQTFPTLHRSNIFSSSIEPNNDRLKSLNVAMKYFRTAFVAVSFIFPIKVSAEQQPQYPLSKGFQTKSGLKYFDLIEGQGPQPKFGEIVSFQYKLFYKSYLKEKLEEIDISKNPFVYKHGNGRICRGIDEAMHTMRVGGKRRAVLSKSIGIFELMI